MVTGSGTSGDPYMLYNLTDLESISTLGLDKYYKLANDIDASATQDASYNSGAGWLPLGNSSTYFTGDFNGDGYTISGLYISRSTTDYIGFFAAFRGTIYDLTIEDPDITGQNYVGAISGSQSGTYTNITLTGGSVTGTATSVGGLLGYSNRTGTTLIQYINPDYVRDWEFGTGNIIDGMKDIPNSYFIATSRTPTLAQLTSAIGSPSWENFGWYVIVDTVGGLVYNIFCDGTYYLIFTGTRAT